MHEVFGKCQKPTGVSRASEQCKFVEGRQNKLKKKIRVFVFQTCQFHSIGAKIYSGKKHAYHSRMKLGWCRSVEAISLGRRWTKARVKVFTGRGNSTVWAHPAQRGESNTHGFVMIRGTIIRRRQWTEQSSMLVFCVFGAEGTHCIPEGLMPSSGVTGL